MTKRILALFLACILAIPLISVPASANEVSDAVWMNLLDYDSVNVTSNFFYYTDVYTVKLDLPVTQNLYYIDAIVSASYAPTVMAVFNSKTTTLTVNQIGDSKNYRIYGELPSGNYKTLNLQFSGSGTTNYCTLLSCNVSSSSMLAYSDGVTLYVKPSSSAYLYQTAGSQVISQLSTASSESAKQLTTYYGYIYLNNWVDYDFADLKLTVAAYTVDAIEIDFDGQTVPLEISYLNTNTPPEEDANPSDTYGTYYPPRYFDISVRVDLRGLDRSITSTQPILKVRGTYYNAHSYQYVAVDEYWGYVATNDIDFVPYFLSNIWDSITSGFSTLKTNLSTWFTTQFEKIDSFKTNVGEWFTTEFDWLAKIQGLLNTLVLGRQEDSGNSQDFIDDIGTQETQIGEMVDDIATAPTANIDDVNNQVGQLEEMYLSGDGTYYTLLSAMIWDNYMIRAVLTSTFVFALIGLMLFGKKG